MKLAEILSGPEKWTKGIYKQSGRFCLMGAIWQTVVSRDYETLRSERHRAERLIGENCAEMWNDAPERTWEEVATVVEAYDRDRLLNP